MNYEVQQALERKVETWKILSLEEEFRRSKSEIDQLERKVGNLEGVVSNYYNLFSMLLDTIAENSDYKEEYANQILSLKQYL